MVKNENLLKTYIGFSIKSNKIVYGLDNLCEYNKPVHLVLCSVNKSSNSYSKITRLCEYKKWEMVHIDNCDVADLTGKNNCKIIGLLDKHIVSGIKDNCF